MLVATQVKAQDTSILSRPFHPSLKKGSIREFLEDLAKQGGIDVEYSSTFLEIKKVITLNGKEATVADLLRQLLVNQEVKAVEINNKLIIVRANGTSPQPVYALYGFIKEDGSKEPLINATIRESATGKGTITNTYGYFSLPLTAGNHTLLVSYIGYTTKTVDVKLSGNTRTDIPLSLNGIVQEIIVTAGNSLKKGTGANIRTDEYEANNNLIGENDPVRSRDLQPGVINIQESTDGVLVRGGNPDQNLFLLDGNEVFNPTHLLGALSIVNKTSFKSMMFYKSDFPSRFGGLISSVTDVYTKDGNMSQWKGEANLGFLAGSATIEGPLIKNKTAVMVSFRHNWMSPRLKLDQESFSTRFYDFHFKITHLLNNNNKLMLNIYNGNDRISVKEDYNNNLQKWGNKLASLGWNHVLGPRSFVNTSFNLSHYNNLAGFQYTIYDDSTSFPVANRVYSTYSSIAHYNLKTQFEVYANNNIKFNFGAKAAYTKIKPFSIDISKEFQEDIGDFKAITPLPFMDYTLYYENEININHRLLIRPGIHFTTYKFRDYHFSSFQPRFFAAYKINATQQFYVAYNKLTQYLHLLNNPFLGMNNMVWVPSTRLLKPEESTSASVGYTYKDKTNTTVSAEVYWKKMYNITNYVDGGNIFSNDSTWEENILTGKGWSYGLELLTEKKLRKWLFTLSYTLSWNWRQFDDLNNGRKFPYKYDRRHVVNLAVAYKPNKNWDISAAGSISSGDVFTMPEKIYPDFDNSQHIIDPEDPVQTYRFIYYNSALNQFRTLPYYRMDIAANYYLTTKKRWQHKFTAGIYNLLGSASKYNYDLQASIDGKFNVVLSKNKLFGVSPFLSYTINF